MSVRPFRDINRKKTRVINVGNVKIGGKNPISIQSMTNTLTTDIKATIKQINQIHNEGADLVRVSCPDEASSKALKEIVKNVPHNSFTNSILRRVKKVINVSNLTPFERYYQMMCLGMNDSDRNLLLTSNYHTEINNFILKRYSKFQDGDKLEKSFYTDLTTVQGVTTDIGVDVSTWMVSAAYDWRADKKWQPYLGAGVGQSTIEVDLAKTVGSVAVVVDDDNITSFKFKAGVNYAADENLDVYGELWGQTFDDFTIGTLQFEDCGMAGISLGLRYKL